ncbi:MAG: helix-turn-helix domain-containing protein [Chthoniobacter sp.]|uniref:helix-turn-helix domain-containing protein n=1 Tax=Chthoniobacter sp. TaxID=2510640 RepID=UPI0032A5E9DB
MQSAVPRKHPIPPQEIKICERLLDARLHKGMSRVAVAKRAEMDSSQLRRYEDGLVPLRYDDAKRLSLALEVGLPYLAGVVARMRDHLSIDDSSFAEHVKPRSLFSEIYTQYLSDIVKASPVVPPKVFLLPVGTKIEAPTREAAEKMAESVRRDGYSVKLKGKVVEFTVDYSGWFVGDADEAGSKEPEAPSPQRKPRPKK